MYLTYTIYEYKAFTFNNKIKCNYCKIIYYIQLLATL